MGPRSVEGAGCWQRLLCRDLEVGGEGVGGESIGWFLGSSRHIFNFSKLNMHYFESGGYRVNWNAN